MTTERDTSTEAVGRTDGPAGHAHGSGGRESGGHGGGGYGHGGGGHGNGGHEGHRHRDGGHAGHRHGEGHGHEQVTENHYTQEFWDERYSSAERLWSGQPNSQLVAQASGLTPGTALDAGCGEGADAIWLASRGWTVTAVDVSAVALERAARHAGEQGADVTARIGWQREDLLTWDPGRQRFDLVSAQYMHMPGELFEGFFGRLAAAVRPGGTLLVVGHHPDDMRANVGRPENLDMFPSAREMAAALDPARWAIEVADAFGRSATDLDGAPTTVRDTVLRATRRR